MYWLKRTLSKSSRNPNTATQQQHEQEHHGITDELINLVKSFTIDTFKNFPLQDEDESSYSEEVESTSTRVRKDLSQWQERHAVLILSNVKEISQLRYVLCPRHLKENQFWIIYFTLARSHLAPVA
ncbi:BSD domain protein [Medicago truncatula]|uniref:BSD domain protein n=1 Tax=Medicago truncatula TaxID=3880 RepID=A0A072UH51_MEDTR|nr:BSD domain protein [Medicago truncatula]